jgi:hypothetical protein
VNSVNNYARQPCATDRWVWFRNGSIALGMESPCARSLWVWCRSWISRPFGMEHTRPGFIPGDFSGLDRVAAS